MVGMTEEAQKRELGIGIIEEGWSAGGGDTAWILVSCFCGLSEFSIV